MKTLVPLGITEIGANAAYVATDRTGRTLLWASYSGGVVGGHAISRNGAVIENPLSLIETARCAHAIPPDASNRFAFVPHTGPNAVYQFRFDAKTGKLTRNDPFTAKPAEGLEPRHLAFHRLPIVYCDDEKGDSVATYTFDRATGQLKAFHTAVPAGFDAAKTPAQILRFRMTARLCTPPTVATTPLPVSPSIQDRQTPQHWSVCHRQNSALLQPESDNKWMVVAGQRSHDLHIYERNSKTGQLIKRRQQPTGQAPAGCG